MLLSDYIERLETLLAKEGDMTVACMTAPCNDGESQVIDDSLINVTDSKPNNGQAKTDKILAVGYKPFTWD